MEEDRQRQAFLAESVRSGLFSAALDIAESMKQGGVEGGEAALLTGAIEFSVQLWTETMLKAGHPPQKVRKSLEANVRTFFQKHKSGGEEVNPS